MEDTDNPEDVQESNIATQDDEKKSTDSVEAKKSQPTNTQRFYLTRGNSAIQAFNDRRWKACYSISTELLADPRLPSFWRAQCNLLMATRDDPTAVEYAKSAVKWADRVLEHKPTDAALLKIRREAQSILDDQPDTAEDAGTPDPPPKK
ncbi:uncharacterized protein AB675_1909 [Cyphellophora attinorum]|uniref:Translocation protein sec72 n=1 Tax=Cyphellophora attinorum TaxID=1664694 RepID=A0A0N1NZY7_9EURO|nr:uncharacterized protein AB675_1909 [Phialophora attinorum]KPI42712.1 hypothetical protein AB675_1909 [Phialophora attinorum]